MQEQRYRPPAVVDLSPCATIAQCEERNRLRLSSYSL
jgi:hypothetical protein